MKKVLCSIIIMLLIIELSSITLILHSNQEIEGKLKYYNDNKIYITQKMI